MKRVGGKYNSNGIPSENIPVKMFVGNHGVSRNLLLHFYRNGTKICLMIL